MNHSSPSDPSSDRSQPDKLSLSTKLAYGAGDMGAGITTILISFSLLIFLTEVAGLDPGLAGTVLMIGKVWDAINDPMIGMLSDRTRSRWGRRRSWMLFGSLPFGLSFFLHWLVPHFSADPQVNQWALFTYYIVVSILFQTAYTAVNLPYTALTPELTEDYNERTSLNSFRFAFSIGGSILALILGVVLTQLMPDLKQMYVALGGICAILSVFPLYWCVFGTRERYQTQAEPTSLSLISQFKIALSNRPFQFVSGIYLFSWLALQLTTTIIPYFVVSWMRRDSFFEVALIVQVVAIIMLFVWSEISKSLGRKAVYFMGMGFWIIAQAGLFFLPRDRMDLMFFLAVLAGVGVATAYLVPWSMLTDVIDLDELNTGQRREGIFYSFMVFLQKLGLGLGIFFVGQTLQWSGFIESAGSTTIPEQPDSALFAIRMAIGPLPTLLLIGGLILAYFYPLSREVHAAILLQLYERKHQASVKATD
ncbi:MFS transporter [Laspinema olomoucense]|uniref:MFS transporter n=1 Tax=Laspinema olomoucense TaxID=3231600 RepID=UPI0021BA83C2|nr:MFS transporter [Laspinema sp. D3d]MCT7975904.1 MFS transporter [Laspinema sp. D3d]